MTRSRLSRWYQIYIYRAPNIFSRDYEFLYSSKLCVSSIMDASRRCEAIQNLLNKDSDCKFLVFTVFRGLTINI